MSEQNLYNIRTIYELPDFKTTKQSSEQLSIADLSVDTVDFELTKRITSNNDVYEIKTFKISGKDLIGTIIEYIKTQINNQFVSITGYNEITGNKVFKSNISVISESETNTHQLYLSNAVLCVDEGAGGIVSKPDISGVALSAKWA